MLLACHKELSGNEPVRPLTTVVAFVGAAAYSVEELAQDRGSLAGSNCDAASISAKAWTCQPQKSHMWEGFV